MNVETLPVGPLEVNCYLAWLNGPDTLVIDPGGDAEEVAAAVSRNSLRVAGYLLTHGHVDHIDALAELYDRHPAPVVLHSADLEWAFEPRNQLQPYYGSPRRPAGEIGDVRDGHSGDVAGLQYTVIGTPGHTPGSVCFWFEQDAALFGGDLLFAGSIGRTDLPGGDARAMTASLQRVMSLPDSTVVYPGHGPATTLGKEKQTNPFFGLIRA